MIKSLCFSSLLVALYSFSLPSHASPCHEGRWTHPPMSMVATLGQSCSLIPGLGAQCMPGLVCANRSPFNIGFGVCALPYGGGTWRGGHPGWRGGRHGWHGGGRRHGGGGHR